MTAAELIVTRLKSLSAVTTLVSTRVRTMVLREHETFPAIRVLDVVEQESMHLRGAAGLTRSLVQVDSYAEATSGSDPYASARDIDQAAYGAGDGTGLCGFTGTIAGVAVSAILARPARREFDPEEQRLVRVMREYEVWHT